MMSFEITVAIFNPNLIIQNVWIFGTIKDREHLEMEAVIISKVFCINEMIFISYTYLIIPLEIIQD